MGKTMTTELIADRVERLNRLRQIRPKWIAVAYVGLGWRKLLGDKLRLKEIVLSPTQGTNPVAVEQIAREIGWENVHFLEELHSKLYVGDGRVMFGSANLSDSGFGRGSTELYELVTYSTDAAVVSDAVREFDRYRSLAIDSYRDEKAKKARVKAMKAARPAVEAARVRLERPDPPALDRFEIGSRRIHLEWYEAEGKETDEYEGDVGDRSFMNVALARSGQMRVGDWLLEWPCTDDGRIIKGFKLSWMRIDAVRTGVHDMEYPDQVAKRTIASSNSQPFQIDAGVTRAFREVIQDWDDLRPKGEEIPLVSPSLSRVKKFLAQAKDRYIELG